MNHSKNVLLALTLELGNKVISGQINTVARQMADVNVSTFWWGEVSDYQTYYPKRIPSDTLRVLIGASRKKRSLTFGDIDALVIHGWEQVIVFRDVIRHKPSAVFMDTTPAQNLRMFRNHITLKQRLFGRLWHVLFRRYLQWATLVCPRTEFCANSIRTDYGIDESRIQVVRHGVDLRTWVPAPEKRPEHPRLLFVGNNFQRKGGPFMLEVKHLLPEQYELVIVSNDPIVGNLNVNERTLVIRGLDHSRLLELIGWYQSSHLLAFPTWNEPFGQVMVEAAACGTPCIVRDLGPQREAVQHEKSGLLMPYHSSPREWASAIQLLFADREKLAAFGVRARQIAEERYSIDRLERQIAQVIASL